MANAIAIVGGAATPRWTAVVLRMIPYGIDVLAADDGKGNVTAATVNGDNVFYGG